MRDIHFEQGQERIYAVGFVGNVGKSSSERYRALTHVLGAFNTNDFTRRYSPRQMDCVYSRSKIVINKSINGDVNMRVLEGLAAGALLVTDKIANGLDEIGSDGEHFVTYESDAEAVEKIQYYLAHDAERQAIAQRGQERVFDRHTYRQRLETVLAVAASGADQVGAPLRSAADNVERIWRSECLRFQKAPFGDIAALLADGYLSLPVVRKSIRAMMARVDWELGRAWS